MLAVFLDLSTYLSTDDKNRRTNCEFGIVSCYYIPSVLFSLDLLFAKKNS